MVESMYYLKYKQTSGEHQQAPRKAIERTRQALSYLRRPENIRRSLEVIFGDADIKRRPRMLVTVAKCIHRDIMDVLLKISGRGCNEKSKDLLFAARIVVINLSSIFSSHTSKFSVFSGESSTPHTAEIGTANLSLVLWNHEPHISHPRYFFFAVFKYIPDFGHAWQ